MFKKLFGLILGSLLLSAPATAGVEELTGPRIGITGLTPGMATDELDTYVISQYGWQFETRFSDTEEMVALAEWVLLVGGMEQGYFLPSVSSLIGIRNANGSEFGLGPNLSISGIGFVLAAGQNFQMGKINLPINLSWVPSNNSPWSSKKTGHRISITCGFNMKTYSSDHFNTGVE